MTKDPYRFDFLTLREKYDEKELKDALINKAEKFIEMNGGALSPNLMETS